MPRGVRNKRRPAAEDLNERQRRIYEALPAELRDEFLAQLPDIAPTNPLAQRKAQQIGQHLTLVEGLIAELSAHRNELEGLARDLENGGDSERVDLRKALSPPTLSGVAMRDVRAGKS